MLHDYVFSCDVSHGVVPAKGKLVLCIRFQPQIVGEHSTAYFTITSAGHHLETVLKVAGSCKGTKAFPVSPCQLLTTGGKRFVLGEGLGTIIACSHRLNSAGILAVPGVLFGIYTCLTVLSECPAAS